jgi:hypothetical protein
MGCTAFCFRSQPCTFTECYILPLLLMQPICRMFQERLPLDFHQCA